MTTNVQNATPTGEPRDLDPTGEWESRIWTEYADERATTEQPRTPRPDRQCTATAGRCEKDAGHDGDHYTEYRDPVWTHRTGPRPDPALDDLFIHGNCHGKPHQCEWDEALRAAAARLTGTASASETD